MPRPRRPDGDRPRSPDPSETWIYGVHPVLEALEASDRSVEKIVVAREAGGTLGRLLREARRAEVPVSRVPRPVLDRTVGRKNHQGVAARVAAVAYRQLAEVTAAALRKDAGLMVLLDRVEDAGNLGAALRACAAVGVDGVVLPTEGSAGLTAAVERASAGTASRVPVARASRLRRAWEGWRAAGFKTAALVAGGETDWDSVDWSGPWILAAGRERDGVRPWLRREADVRIALPLAPGIESLNVSVALGAVLYERLRSLKK